MENEDFGLDAFEGALFGDDYQTDADMDAERSENTETKEPEAEEASEEETEQEAADSDVGGKNAEGESDHGNQDEKPEGDAKPEDAAKKGEELFTLKVNKQERQVTREEVISLAQKGADYDRVKQQYTDSQHTIQALREKADAMDKSRDILDVLDMVAKGSKTPVEQLVESLYISYRKSSGISEDAAKLELKNAQLSKELSAAKSQTEKADSKRKTEEASTRLQQDMAEFQREYPEVELTDELVDQLAEDIKSGMSLTAAYRKMERKQQEDRVAELERQLAAEKQNKKNRRSSPGSQRDSGGRGKNTDEEIFEKALFG